MMTLEICVDSVESARAAAAGGATRLELCGNLIIGGTSPSPYLIEAVQKLDVPVRVLLRPRFGDFLYTPSEQEILYKEVELCRSLGVDGVVIGALCPDGTLDVPFLSSLVEAAGPLGKTLHRAFDVCADAQQGLETAVTLGFDTILTSGQAATALEGVETLAQLQQQADGRITLLAGSGVSPENIPVIRERTGISAFHMSGKRTVEGGMRFRREGVPMGLPFASEYERFYTDEGLVRSAYAALTQK